MSEAGVHVKVEERHGSPVALVTVDNRAKLSYYYDVWKYLTQRLF
jgi:hypothetical protein